MTGTDDLWIGAYGAEAPPLTQDTHRKLGSLRRLGTYSGDRFSSRKVFTARTLSRTPTAAEAVVYIKKGLRPEPRAPAVPPLEFPTP
jgi:hypothetical protein